MKLTMAQKIGIAGIMLLSIILALAIVGPFAVPYDSNEQTGAPLQIPDAHHLLGTNDMGQDICAELVEGARVSLFIGIASALMATVIGALVGMLSGYWGGWMDVLFMRIVDVSLTLPFLPLMIVIGVYLGPSIFTQLFVITLVLWARNTNSFIAYEGTCIGSPIHGSRRFVLVAQAHSSRDFSTADSAICACC